MFYFTVQSCHLLLVAAQWWRAGFRLTRAYFGVRVYIMSILKNHTRAYFQGNKVDTVDNFYFSPADVTAFGGGIPFKFFLLQ